MQLLSAETRLRVKQLFIPWFAKFLPNDGPPISLQVKAWRINEQAAVLLVVRTAPSELDSPNPYNSAAGYDASVLCS